MYTTYCYLFTCPTCVQICTLYIAMTCTLHKEWQQESIRYSTTMATSRGIFYSYYRRTIDKVALKWANVLLWTKQHSSHYLQTLVHTDRCTNTRWRDLRHHPHLSLTTRAFFSRTRPSYTPISMSISMASLHIASPQILSLGNFFFSNSSTFFPSLAR